MIKFKIFLVLAAAALLVTLMALGCATTPAQKPAATAPAAPATPAATTPAPSTPATTAPAPTTPAPAPTAPAAPAKLSFSPKTYTSTDYNFSVKYPDDWKDLPIKKPSPTFMYVGSPMQVPVFSISAYNAKDFTTQIEERLSSVSNAFKFKWEGPNAVTLSDGKTKGNTYYMSYEIPGVPLKTLWLTVDIAEGKTVAFAWTTITSSFEDTLDMFKESMSTVEFK